MSSGSSKSSNNSKKKAKANKNKAPGGEATSTTTGGGLNPALSSSTTVSQARPECVAHKFEWNHGGGVVKVTGTFDNWKQTLVLTQSLDNQDHFEITVDIDRSQKILFKFVVDGQWRCADELPTEYDSAGNQNNVLPAIAT